MKDNPFEKVRLTKQQVACLGKVAEHKDSLQIAFELGIAKSTVDIHIAKAVAKLGVGSRREAAKLLLEWRDRNSDRISSYLISIANERDSAPETTVSEQNGSLLRDGSDVGDKPPRDPVTVNLPQGDGTANRYDLNAFRTFGLSILLVFATSLMVIASIPMSSAIQDIIDFCCGQSNSAPDGIPAGMRRSKCSRNVEKQPEMSPQPYVPSNKRAISLQP